MEFPLAGMTSALVPEMARPASMRAVVCLRWITAMDLHGTDTAVVRALQTETAGGSRPANRDRVEEVLLLKAGIRAVLLHRLDGGTGVGGVRRHVAGEQRLAEHDDVVAADRVRAGRQASGRRRNCRRWPGWAEPSSPKSGSAPSARIWSWSGSHESARSRRSTGIQPGRPFGISLCSGSGWCRLGAIGRHICVDDSGALRLRRPGRTGEMGRERCRRRAFHPPISDLLPNCERSVNKRCALAMMRRPAPEKPPQSPHRHAPRPGTMGVGLTSPEPPGRERERPLHRRRRSVPSSVCGSPTSVSSSQWRSRRRTRAGVQRGAVRRHRHRRL